MRIFVYGTLKKGNSAEHLLDEGLFIGEAVTHPRYHIYDVGFPGMVVGGETGGVHGEVYDVDEKCIVGLDEYEGEGFLFGREEIELEDGSAAMAYIFLHPIEEKDTHIQNGIWKEEE